MFREMRRGRQALSEEACEAILDRGTSGVLALSGDEGYPYAVPLSYVRDGRRLYFHCAKSGHKLDAVKRNEKASFCVIGQDTVVKYTTRYQSVIVFGRTRVVEDEAQKRAAIELLAKKYAPDDTEDGRKKEIEREWASLCVLELQIDHMTGKEGMELVRERKPAGGN